MNFDKGMEKALRSGGDSDSVTPSIPPYNRMLGTSPAPWLLAQDLRFYSSETSNLWIRPDRHSGRHEAGSIPARIRGFEMVERPLSQVRGPYNR